MKNGFEAYLIGLAQTDGHLADSSRNRGKFSLELKISDIGILQDIAKNIGFNYSIRTRTRDTNFKDQYESATLTVCNQEFRDFLKLNGVPAGKKSEIIRPPLSAKDPLAIDYLRGLIDGDGSVGISALNRPFLGIVTSSEYIKDFFIEWVHFNCERKFQKVSRTKRDGMYQPTVWNEDAQKITNLLYYENCISIVRKYEKAQMVKGWERDSTINKITFARKYWTPTEDDIVLKNTIEESMTILGRTKKSVQIRKLRLENPLKYNSKIKLAN